MIYFIVITSTVQFGFLLFNLTGVQSLSPKIKHSDFGTNLPTENQSWKLDIAMAMNVWNKLFDAVDESSIVIWRIFRCGIHWKHSPKVLIHNVFRRSRAANLRVFDHSGSFADCNTSYFNIFHFNGHRLCSASVFQGESYLSSRFGFILKKVLSKSRLQPDWPDATVSGTTWLTCKRLSCR